MILHVPGASSSTPVCAFYNGIRKSHISSDIIRKFLRTVCTLHGGKAAFGFGPQDIGNKSIRSGAAMALFLADHSPAKIMILGRWSSDAFLVYIRPQVLEWTNNMSYDMTHYESFLDLSTTRRRNTSQQFPSDIIPPFHGRDSSIIMPKLHLIH